MNWVPVQFPGRTLRETEFLATMARTPWNQDNYASKFSDKYIQVHNVNSDSQLNDIIHIVLLDKCQVC